MQTRESPEAQLVISPVRRAAACRCRDPFGLLHLKRSLKSTPWPRRYLISWLCRFCGKGWNALARPVLQLVAVFLRFTREGFSLHRWSFLSFLHQHVKLGTSMDFHEFFNASFSSFTSFLLRLPTSNDAHMPLEWELMPWSNLRSQRMRPVPWRPQNKEIHKSTASFDLTATGFLET